MADVDTSAWDGAAAMSRCAQSDDPAAAYRAICAGRRDGDPALQSTWALPHHANPGDPPNADGVRNSLSRLPQAEGLVNAEAAQSHLDAHMADIRAASERSDESANVRTFTLGSDLEVRDAIRREIGIRIVPWDTVVSTPQGLEEFKRGAFSGVDPARVILRMDHQDPPAGRGLSLEEGDVGADMVFRVSKTQRGDEILTLAIDGVTTGASVGFFEVPGGTSIETRNGRRVRVHRRSDLREVSTTWKPVFERAAVQYVRSQEPTEGEAPMAETLAPEIGAVLLESPTIDVAPLNAAVASMVANMSTFADRLEKMEERSRSNIIIPNAPSAPQRPDSGVWMQSVLRMLSGERIPDMQMRALEDLITTDNIGVVPDAYLARMIGKISKRRPFMESTEKLETPTAGMSLVVPRIVTRPVVAQQMTEKAELESTKTCVDTVTFDAVTKGGAGDISLQLLKRSSPSFLTLYLDLLAEAYAIETEVEAVEALLASGSGSDIVNDGGVFDPENSQLGQSWINGNTAGFDGPNTIWLSSAAVGAFIDAKAPLTNAPLYSNLMADFTAAGGVGGSISGLRPVHVPALNSTAVDVIVGPSAGYCWAEDGTYTLQVDVPAKAGKDVAIVGILWFAPLYPAAFTAWSLGS